MAATTRPLPPFLPESQAQFAEHVAVHPADWFESCEAAYAFIDQTVSSDVIRTELSLCQLHNAELEQKITELNHNAATHLAVIEYQRTEHRESLSRLTKDFATALAEKDKVQSSKALPVITPRSSPVPESASEAAPVSTARAPLPPSTPYSEYSRVSEKLPDPDKFAGERKDLRRFTSQIHGKLAVNRDRFPTAQARMTYVTNRLSDSPYAQVLPYIKDGLCELSDYHEILAILDRAYGDPNRINNARSELFRYKQTNKEFSAFLVEFQRLGLEAEMTDESFATRLEQAVSKELKAMLLHNEPSSRKYPDLAAFLQKLDNRRQYYSQNPAPPAVRHVVAMPSRPSTRDSQKDSNATPTKGLPVIGDPMDLSTQRHPTRTDKETGNCFRCHRPGHLVRDCPLPDNRPAEVQRHDQSRRIQEMQLRSSSPTISTSSVARSAPQSPRIYQQLPVTPIVPNLYDNLPSSPQLSGNGTRLEEVAPRR